MNFSRDHSRRNNLLSSCKFALEPPGFIIPHLDESAFLSELQSLQSNVLMFSGQFPLQVRHLPFQMRDIPLP
jgi:hypothetical protein